MRDTLIHYGTPRHSGRYPWGSGDEPYQHTDPFLASIAELKAQGLSEVEIARGLGLSSTEFREQKSLAKTALRASKTAMAWRLREKGYSNVEIGKHLGINESSVRALLDPALSERNAQVLGVADYLKSAVAEKKYIDIGVGTELSLGIKRTKLQTAVAKLKEEGYQTFEIPVEQVGTGKITRILTLAPPGSTFGEVAKNKYDIQLLDGHTEDGGRSFLGLEPIRNVTADRIHIQYGDQGGSDKDGVIELRRGVPELSLGSKNYAQVRIGVNGTHYLKGMALYADDLPDGVDIRYNTNKPTGTDPFEDVNGKGSVFKKMETDPDNPFGSIVRQNHYVDDKGERQLSALNIVGFKDNSGEEGYWGEWSKTLSSQVLAKQTPALAQKQLDLAYEARKAEFDEIQSLTNPAVKKKMLMEFADQCESDAVHLKAAALPRQRTHVILPLPDLKENEVYAPNYRDGEQVVLIRHPHGGIFEIPQLRVNNKNPQGKAILGTAQDAVGINPVVAQRLSGADFDGDTVLVIPNPPSIGIKTAPAQKKLIDFDPKLAYPGYEGMTVMSEKVKGIEMGNISNLITDMTIQGADLNEIVRAVRHSMVVIDAAKHKLNYKQSAIDNGIPALKKKYQGKANSGASTLISRASATLRVDERKEGKLITDPMTGKTHRVYIDPQTGKKLYDETGATYVKDGKVIKKQTKTTPMAETDDAFTLSSGTRMEAIYATHANKLKTIAGAARKEAISTPNARYSPSANRAYRPEVDSLLAKLNVALKNKPKERQAQLLADSIVRTKRKNNPHLEADDIKKIKTQALIEARTRVGAGKETIDITDKEWEAIQAGAISHNVLSQILLNSKPEVVKQLATPRQPASLSAAKISKAKAMLAAGRTRAEIADALGISVSTLSRILN